MPRKDFPEDVRRKCLLWSARHCCLCGNECGLDIEIAHLPGMETRDDLESAIPLCHTCHAQIGRYNPKHPLGSKYNPEELRLRREQVYEQYTRHLVPSAILGFLEYPTGLPRVGSKLINNGQFPPVKAKVKLRVFLGEKEIMGVNDQHGYYCGETEWHLNPSTAIHGNFTIAEECVKSTETLRIQVSLTIIDFYDRPHEQLPECHLYDRARKIWILEPTSFENLRDRAREKQYKL
jgi:hypothetical protein